ncbi:MAG: VOC family protein [Pseudomonadota bacterium]
MTEGLHAVTPYLTVDDADLLMRFVSEAFDAETVKLNRYEDGTIQHARMLIGDALIMLNQSTETYAAIVSQLYVYVDDADSTYAAALTAGAQSRMEPNLRPHGDRMAGVTDPCGNIWWIATKIV